MIRYIGIDPGLSGAIAFLGTDRVLIVHDMPTLEVERNGKAKREIDLGHLSALLPLSGYHVVMEKVGAMPGQGVSSMFSFGRSVGQLEGVIAAHGLPITYVSPVKWKRDLSVPAGKDAARLRASQLLPIYAERWYLKKHDGRAEAALIALWAVTHLEHQFIPEPITAA